MSRPQSIGLVWTSTLANSLASCFVCENWLHGPTRSAAKRFAMAKGSCKNIILTSLIFGGRVRWSCTSFGELYFFFCHSCSFTYTLSSSQKGEPAQFFYGLRRKIFRKNRTGVNTRQHFHVYCAPRHPLRALCEPPGGFEEPRKSPLSWKLICHAACPRQGTAPQTPPDTLILT